jgi:hypothetical protein
MPLHAVTIFRLDDTWYIFDSTMAEFARRGLLDSLIRESMDPPLDDVILWLENDKYFINFGAGSPLTRPYLEQPFSNMEPSVLLAIIDNITAIFNDSQLGSPGWDIQDFIDTAIPCPDIKTVSIPYSVVNATGATDEEKARSLMNLNKRFMQNCTGEETINQFDRSFYGMGELEVAYPQAYANAAKYAVITSFFATKLDTRFSYLDCLKVSLWINGNVLDKTILPVHHVAQSDLLYLRHAGSSLDQAILAYGTMRNMKNAEALWQPTELFILVTEDYEGLLAVHLPDEWIYLHFGKGALITSESPQNIKMAFNECECLQSWGQ